LEDVENEEAIKAIFEGFEATVDEPGNLFYQTFMKLNPNAKVILTVRDSAESWATSARNTIFNCNNTSGLIPSHIKRLLYVLFKPPQIQLVHKIMADKKFHGVDPNDPKTDLARMYTDWNNRVIETVPAEQLLIFNVKEGWKPLCDFLGVPVPDTPFPRVNSTANFKEMMGVRIKKRMGDFLLKCLLVVAIGSGAVVMLTHFG